MWHLHEGPINGTFAVADDFACAHGASIIGADGIAFIIAIINAKRQPVCGAELVSFRCPDRGTHTATDKGADRVLQHSC